MPVYRQFSLDTGVLALAALYQKGVVGFDGASAENVTFSYGAETVLEGVSLQIPKGKIIGLAGKSSSGKSTLLKLFMLMGTLYIMRKDCQLAGFGIEILADGRYIFYGRRYGHVRIRQGKGRKHIP